MIGLLSAKSSIEHTRVILLGTLYNEKYNKMAEGIGAIYLEKPVKSNILKDNLILLLSQKQHGKILSSAKTIKQPHYIKTKDGRGKNVLVAEDNEINMILIVELLKDAGYNVVTASNGQQAIELIEANDVDLVLMDVQMPVMGGIEASNIIREKEKLTGVHLPIIAMTASAMTGDRELCLQAGMDEYISKPIVEDELYRCLREYTRIKPYSGLSINNKPTEIESIFDYDMALNYLGGKDELLKRIIKMFLEHRNEYLDDIEKAIKNKDFDGLKKSAHKIKGSLANIGAMSSSKIASKLEHLASAQDIDSAADEFAKLLFNLAKYKDAVSQYLEGKYAKSISG